eukprot:6324484-Prymnesium_polylepis.1
MTPPTHAAASPSPNAAAYPSGGSGWVHRPRGGSSRGWGGRNRSCSCRSRLGGSRCSGGRPLCY